MNALQAASSSESIPLPPLFEEDPLRRQTRKISSDSVIEQALRVSSSPCVGKNLCQELLSTPCCLPPPQTEKRTSLKEKLSALGSSTQRGAIKTAVVAAHVATIPLKMINQGVSLLCSTTSTTQKACSFVGNTLHQGLELIPHKIRKGVSRVTHLGMDKKTVASLAKKGIPEREGQEFVHNIHMLTTAGFTIGSMTMVKQLYKQITHVKAPPRPIPEGTILSPTTQSALVDLSEDSSKNLVATFHGYETFENLPETSSLTFFEELTNEVAKAHPGKSIRWEMTPGDAKIFGPFLEKNGLDLQNIGTSSVGPLKVTGGDTTAAAIYGETALPINFPIDNTMRIMVAKGADSSITTQFLSKSDATKTLYGQLEEIPQKFTSLQEAIEYGKQDIHPLLTPPSTPLEQSVSLYIAEDCNGTPVVTFYDYCPYEVAESATQKAFLEGALTEVTNAFGNKPFRLELSPSVADTLRPALPKNHWALREYGTTVMEVLPEGEAGEISNVLIYDPKGHFFPASEQFQKAIGLQVEKWGNSSVTTQFRAKFDWEDNIYGLDEIIRFDALDKAYKFGQTNIPLQP